MSFPVALEKIDFCARAAHEVNRAYCDVIAGGHDPTQTSWDGAPEWQRQSCRSGVIGVLGLGHTPEQSHQAWLAEKFAAGWTYGPVKDPERKQHPCMVPYDQLPLQQRAKDTLFVAVVRATAAAYVVSLIESPRQ